VPLAEGSGLFALAKSGLLVLAEPEPLVVRAADELSKSFLTRK
jgi:hypothetical protein